MTFWRLGLFGLIAFVPTHHPHHASTPTATVTAADPTTTTTTEPVPTTTTTTEPPPLVSDAVMAEWAKVAMCEEGGNWHVRGSAYSGGLGISNHNWVAYGGAQFAYSAADATPEQQVFVAERIQANPPDQNGCAAW